MRRKSAKFKQTDCSSHRTVHKKPTLFRRKRTRSTVNRSQKPFFTPVVQPKLTVNEPDDKYEREADRVADTVMRMPDSLISRQPVEEEEEELQMKEKSPAMQRKCAECEEEEKRLQRTPLMGNDTPFFQRQETGEGKVNPQTAASLQTTKSGGNPLPDNTRNWMENRFGTDFSGVKIHTDSKAVQLNRDLHAKAFTHGNDIYFNRGEFSPGTSEGKRLLAHELTHVLQQSDGRRKQHARQSKELDKPIESQYIQRAPWYKFWIDERHSRPGSTLTAINVDPDSKLKFDTGWQRSDIGSALLAVATGLTVNRVSKMLKLTKSIAEGVGLLVGGLTAYEGYQVEQRVWGETVSFHEWYGRYQVNVFTGDLIAVDFQGTGEEQRTIAIPYFFQERVADADGNPVYTHTRHELTVPGIEVREPEFPERSFGTFE